MEQKPFQITAVKKGDTAEIRIIGVIGWETDAEDFRAQVGALINDGIQNAHIYIQSPGGSCFDANEIVNIISKFKGTVSGEGGSLVASAATYIALHCKTFSMPENGMFMIHKPSGIVAGKKQDIESYAKLIADCEKQYYDTYKAASTNVELFDKKWNDNADWWMTAQEAKDNGFISVVGAKLKINRETAQAITACGCPFEIEVTENNNPKNQTEMDVKTTALMLGMPETATEEEVKAKLQANAQAATDLAALQQANAAKEKTEKEAKIKAILDNAIAGKRIKADCRAEWEKMLTDNFETTSKALEGIEPVEKLSSQLVTSTEGKKTYKGKTFAQLQDENPELLAELEINDPDAFVELYNETYNKGGKI